MFHYIATHPILTAFVVFVVAVPLLYVYAWLIGYFGTRGDDKPEPEAKPNGVRHVRIVPTLTAARELLDAAERDGAWDMTCDDVAAGYVVKWMTESKCACGEVK